VPAPSMLTDADREEISRGSAEQVESKIITERLGRCPSVVSCGIRRHGDRLSYRATLAGVSAAGSRRRPKTRKLDADPVRAERVKTRLRAGCSPDQVAGRLRYESAAEVAAATAADQAVPVAETVSHEAIYTWLYALPKGELAAQGLLLRSGRVIRRPRGRKSSPGARIVGMRSIEDRPESVADRAVPGAWEGDLVIGKVGKTAMATLVERTSGYAVPVALPGGRKDAQTTCNALIGAVASMPTQLVTSLRDCPDFS